MSGLFGGSKTKTPEPPAPEPPPAVEDADVAARTASDDIRKRRGAAAMVLTGKDGAGTPTTATKTLLGG